MLSDSHMLYKVIKGLKSLAHKLPAHKLKPEFGNKRIFIFFYLLIMLRCFMKIYLLSNIFDCLFLIMIISTLKYIKIPKMHMI